MQLSRLIYLCSLAAGWAIVTATVLSTTLVPDARGPVTAQASRGLATALRPLSSSPAVGEKRAFQIVAEAETAVTTRKATVKSLNSGTVRLVATMPRCSASAPTQMPSDSISCWKVA
jgi:hypothetical protein